MTESHTGALLYHDTPTHTDPDWLANLFESKCNDGAPLADRFDTMILFVAGDLRKARRKKANARKALEAISTGNIRALAFSSRTDAPASTRVSLALECGNVEFAQADAVGPWMYEFRLVAGFAALSPDGVADVACRFAERTGPKAGVVVCKAASDSLHSYLSLAPNRETLTAAEVAYVDGVDTRQFGEKIRGPEWGTFLSGAHVEKLGGFDALVALPGVARRVGDGAFLQATADPDHESLPARLAELREALAPVLP